MSDAHNGATGRSDGSTGRSGGTGDVFPGLDELRQQEGLELPGFGEKEAPQLCRREVDRAATGQDASLAGAQAGTLVELDTIAATIIGGTSVRGGEGTIFGAIVGALLMASVNNGMSLMNLSSDVQMIVRGAILLLAVWCDISSRKTAD